MSRFTYVNKPKLVTPKGGVGHKPFRKHRFDRWINKPFGAMINKSWSQDRKLILDMLNSRGVIS